MTDGSTCIFWTTTFIFWTADVAGPIKKQRRLVRPWVSGDVVNRWGAEGTRFEFWHSSGSPLVQELAHEAERVDLVVMLARRKTEQLCFQVR